MPKPWPIQIDPINCGCTECIIGQYVPLQYATEYQIDRMIAGKISDATGMTEYDFDQYMTKRFDW